MFFALNAFDCTGSCRLMFLLCLCHNFLRILHLWCACSLSGIHPCCAYDGRPRVMGNDLCFDVQDTLQRAFVTFYAFRIWVSQSWVALWSSVVLSQPVHII